MHRSARRDDALERGPTRVVLQVIDNGGCSSALQSEVFDSFAAAIRLVPPTSSTGLRPGDRLRCGQAHNGTITVSKLTRIYRFAVRLPAADGNRPDQIAARPDCPAPTRCSQPIDTL